MPAKIKLAMFLSSVLSLASAQVMAAPSASMLGNTCAGCHGTNGISTGPAAPTIAGNSATYLADVMKAYKSGDRYGTIMNRIARGYTDEEIELIANYYAELPYQSMAAKQDLDSGMVSKGKKIYKKNCSKCHDEGGTLADDEAGMLGGQWHPYLAYMLEDYKSGRAEMPKKMARKVEKLSDDELAAVLQYFASQE